MVAGLGHPGADAEPETLVGADQLHLVGVEAKVVQPSAAAR